MIIREFDQNDDLIRETTWDADPVTIGDANKLAETSATFTSFGGARMVEEVLEAGTQTAVGEEQWVDLENGLVLPGL